MSKKVRAIVKDLSDRLHAIYGPRLARMMLYGSQARGDADPQSDVDVLVVLRGEVKPCEEIARTAEDVAAVSLQHNAVVACTFLSEEEFRSRNTPFLLNVRREGIPV